MKITPTININNIPEKEVLSPEFQIDFTTNSDGEITYGSSDESVAIIDRNGVITITGAGICSIIIFQLESNIFESIAISKFLTVKKSNQDIIFTPTITTKPISDKFAEIEIYSNIGLPLIIENTNNSIFDLQYIGNDKYKIVFKSVGSSTIVATQIGNHSFNSVTKNLSIDIVDTSSFLEVITNINVNNSIFKHDGLDEVNILTSNKGRFVATNSLVLTSSDTERGISRDIGILNLNASDFINEIQSFSSDLLCSSGSLSSSSSSSGSLSSSSSSSGSLSSSSSSSGSLSSSSSSSGSLSSSSSSSSLPLLIPNIANTLRITNIQSESFTAQWDPVLNAQNYSLEVSTTPNFSTFVNNYNGKIIEGLLTQVTGLNSGTSYYSRVRGLNNTIYGVYSPPAFTTTIPYAFIDVTEIQGNYGSYQINGAIVVNTGDGERFALASDKIRVYYTWNVDHLPAGYAVPNAFSCLSRMGDLSLGRQTGKAITGPPWNTLGAGPYTYEPSMEPAASYSPFAITFTINNPSWISEGIPEEVGLGTIRIDKIEFTGLGISCTKNLVCGESSALGPRFPHGSGVPLIFAVFDTDDLSEIPSFTDTYLIPPTISSRQKGNENTLYLILDSAGNRNCNYILDVAKNSSFTNFVPNYNNITINSRYLTMNNLEPKTKYYFRVRASSSYYPSVSAYSDTFSQVTAPLPPISLTTSNVTANSFLLSWEDNVDVVAYSVDVSTNSNFNNFLPGYFSAGVASTFINITGLLPNTTYHARVRSRSSSIWSESTNSVIISQSTS